MVWKCTRFSVDEGEGDEDLDFRLNLWSDSLASAMLTLKQFFERIGQEDVSVELKWTSERGYVGILAF